MRESRKIKDFLNIFLLDKFILLFSSGKYRIKCCLVYAGICSYIVVTK